MESTEKKLASKPPLKLFDPTGPDWSAVGQPNQDHESPVPGVVPTLCNIAAAIIALAITVAALGVLVLACNFVKWAMFG